MKDRAIAITLGFSFSLVSACTGTAESTSRAEVSDSPELEVVYSGSQEWGKEEAWTVPFRPQVVIGVLNGPEEYQLVEIADAARRSDGSFVVSDRGARTVRFYDSDGAFLETFGGPGSGPGEFTDPGPVVVRAGDSVVVWDQALLRATTFDAEGDLAQVLTVDWGKLAGGLEIGTVSAGGGKGAAAKSAAPGLYPGPMEPLEDGGLLVRLVEKAVDPPSSGFHRPRSGALRVSRDLSVVDTLLFFPGTEEVTVQAPWGPSPLPAPLARETRIAHGGTPSRICIGDQEGGEITCLGPEGEGISIRWDPEPAPVLGAEVDAWKEAIVQDYAVKLDRRQVLEMLDQVPPPEARPAYSRLILDEGGNLWAERGPTEGRDRGSVDFLVFDPQGVLLGTVALPPVEVLEIGEDYVMGIHRDEFEVEYLQLFPLEKPSNGGTG